mmetsp:Transcript_5290/g.18774  ORF Transcript_5290/g.18774 Transcript_5290/m.18774 type:complete len:215 (-) Transcript_5290:531-1175(-)
MRLRPLHTRRPAARRCILVSQFYILHKRQTKLRGVDDLLAHIDAEALEHGVPLRVSRVGRVVERPRLRVARKVKVGQPRLVHGGEGARESTVDDGGVGPRGTVGPHRRCRARRPGPPDPRVRRDCDRGRRVAAVRDDLVLVDEREVARHESKVRVHVALVAPRVEEVPPLLVRLAVAAAPRRHLHAPAGFSVPGVALARAAFEEELRQASEVRA